MNDYGRGEGSDGLTESPVKTKSGLYSLVLVGQSRSGGCFDLDPGFLLLLSLTTHIAQNVSFGGG